MPDQAAPVVEPSPAPIDWQLAQSLFIEGQSAAKIAVRLGVQAFTVQKRAVRGKWSKLRDEIGTIKVQATGQVLKRERDALQEASNMARKGLSDEVLEQIGHFSTNVRRGRSLENAMGRAQTARTLAETAKTVYGWDAASGHKTVINVAVLDECIDAGPAIDVPKPTSE